MTDRHGLPEVYTGTRSNPAATGDCENGARSIDKATDKSTGGCSRRAQSGRERVRPSRGRKGAVLPGLYNVCYATGAYARRSILKVKDKTKLKSLKEQGAA
jgi:hypothetical protein